MKLLLYCTKNKWRLFFDKVKQVFTLGKVKSNNDLNGKIVAECDYEVEEINYRSAKIVCNRYYLRVLDKSCLTDKEMYCYLKGEKGYAIHIKNLHIFDEPRDIKDLVLLNQYRKDLEWTQYNRVKTAPQNMCLVDYSVNAVDKYKNYIFDCPYVLISIRPEWLCKILNGEKTIEVRKKVLKEMLKNDKRRI